MLSQDGLPFSVFLSIPRHVLNLLYFLSNENAIEVGAKVTMPDSKDIPLIVIFSLVTIVMLFPTEKLSKEEINLMPSFQITSFPRLCHGLIVVSGP